MSVFRTIFYWFSQYTDPNERRVGRFLSQICEHDTSYRTQQNLIALLQEHIAVMNIWTEARYKGYAYLNKATRRQLYHNLASIHTDFETYRASQTVAIDSVVAHIRTLGVDTAKLRQYSEQLTYIVCIMRYLSPKNGRYAYRASSSFGRLLQNPRQHKLEGDCNQIVTLYLSLYAAKYDIRDLALTVYPGHVALHFCGVDVETTTGEFAVYHRKDQDRVPVQEIVSINLLDTEDSNFKKNTVSPAVFLQSARLAYILSSHRPLVEKNLAIAYHNTVGYLMRRHDYATAATYAKQSQDMELIELSAYNGALYALQQKQFRAARKFAQNSSKKRDLLRHIDHNEAVYLYNSKKYKEALVLFERSAQVDMVKRCYEALYFEEQRALKGVKTVSDLRGQARTIHTMQHYAKRSGNTKLVEHANSLAKQL